MAGAIAPLIPHPIDNSFPSGHALFSGSLFVALFRYYRVNWIIILALILAVITLAARMIGGVHYLGDILAGLVF
jgi:membrane-associated phospholipid phosphatase